MHKISERTALVSAAADGLDEGIVRRRAAEDARRGAMDRSSEGRAKSAVRPEMASVRSETVDLAYAREVAVRMEQLATDGYAFDIPVNNAGGSLHLPRAPVEEMDEDCDRGLGLDVAAAVRLIRLAIPGMVQRKYARTGTLGSNAGRYGSICTGADHGAAKGAVQSMKLQIAQELCSHGMTCNAVCHDTISTPRMPPEACAKVIEGITLRRRGRIRDGAAAFDFLVSGEASFVTGQFLDVNGGQGMAS